ncbi:hypothetical protein [uncultured Mucilaginibacter sp.]|uniref:hypothetical protein n=1 Tax=uncultured Mucilaginibacter sp. TaxID=797541 RepID=UPI0025E82EB4|nr:hypothetical protein [uncultured Mucilaginibacter sp.]
MATTLKTYGDSKGYGLPLTFYNDLCWAGLTSTSAFTSLTQTEQDRINNFLSVQEGGYDLSNNPGVQQGTIGGCGN